MDAATIDRIPATFRALDSGWTLRALNPQAAPEALRDRLAVGVPAEVPGEATVDLHREGLIGDPFDGDNESAQQWIGDVDWVFSCVFDWHDDGSERHDLVAYGLDTVAQIRLNGRLVGHTENFFRAWRWDVRGHLLDGRNELEVAFAAPVAATDALERAQGYYPHSGHAFSHIRKPGYSFGWDWGIDAANAGIWRPIGIDSWSGVRIDAVRPAVRSLADGSWQVDVRVDVERAATSHMTTGPEARRDNRPVDVEVRLAGHGFDGRRDVVVDAARIGVETSLTIDDPALWWPRGYGEQPLYDLTVRVGDDVRRERIGLRTIDVDTAADAVGRPFRFRVNGTPIHARGYNWIPDHTFISQVDEEDYRRGMRDLVESNSNMVRVWGGGIYEADAFYDLADELGVLVWQDFALACAAYPEDPVSRAEVELEAREQIIRLMPHASLALWNGSNECRQAYAGWDGYRQDLRDDDLSAGPDGYGERGWGDWYYGTLLPGLLAELDPSRRYLPSSPMSLSEYAPVNLETDGTSHIWDIWNAADYRTYAQYRPRFADEFGYQAPPAWSTLARVVHDTPMDPFGYDMLVHQKATLGNEKLALGMRSHLTEGRFHDVRDNGDGTWDWLLDTDRWDDIEDWHWACQLQQAQAIRYGIDHMRSIEPVNDGALIWQLNDSWPVISWSAVDFDGHRKPLWYASRAAFAPRYAVIRPKAANPKPKLTWERYMPEPDCLELTAVNDTRESWSGVWTVRLVSIADGAELASATYPMSLDAGGVGHVVLDVALAAGMDSPDAVLVAEATTDVAAAGPAFARVVFDPVDVIGQHLDPRPFDATVRPADGGFALEVRARSYVRDLFCMADKVDAEARVDDGMVSLLPGECATLYVRCPSAAGDGVRGGMLMAANVLRCANDLKRRR